MTATNSITVLVHAYANGDKVALDRLLPLVYAQLRRIAQKHLRDERPGHTLQPTALVHEMYAKLAVQSPPELRDRIHFLSVAAHVMRQILIDHARTKYAQKRGARQQKLSLDEAQDACVEKPAVMVRIDDALNELANRGRVGHRPRIAGSCRATRSAGGSGLASACVESTSKGKRKRGCCLTGRAAPPSSALGKVKTATEPLTQLHPAMLQGERCPTGRSVQHFRLVGQRCQEFFPSRAKSMVQLRLHG